MLVALAAVWFIVFLPSVTKRNQDKDEVARDRRVRKEKLTVSASPFIAEQVKRAKTKKRLFVSVVVTAAVAGLVALFQGWTIAAVIAVAVAAASAVMARLATAKASRAIATGSSRRTKIGSGLEAPLEAEVEPVEDSTWKPTQVPAQTYQGRVGTLETATLADVVKIEFSQELDRETLDEILRRRRAN
jgi:hypothetical protein